VKDIIELSKNLISESNCDGVAVAVLDFSNHTYRSFENLNNEICVEKSKIYFDYASLTKPLMNSFTYIANKLSDEELYLLLNHRAGIPAWGLLPKHNWRDQILSYQLKKSTTEYSDFSALRYMLDFSKKTSKDFKNSVFENLDPKIKFWLDMTGKELCLQNGYYNQKPNIGCVHDPNSYNIKDFTNHAGLFGTIESLAKTFLDFDKNFNLLEKVNDKINNEKHEHRYVYGFDTVSDTENTLAGAGCSPNTFGHLGFTGTSVWIDPEQQLGHIILTNSTKEYWFDKEKLNIFRKTLGNLTWQKNIG
jgi:hypothetical protein